MTSNIVNTTPVEVVFLGGKKEFVAVPRLTIEQLYIWARHVRDQSTPALVVLCTGKDMEWVNRLEDDSFATIAQKCVELNFPRAVTLSQKDPVMAGLMGPLLVESVVVLNRMSTAIGESLNASSPVRAPSASAAVNGTELSSSLPSGLNSSSAKPGDSAPRNANTSSPS